MADDNLYKQTFNAAIKELSDLMERRDELDILREELNARITKIRRGALALSSLAGEEPQKVKVDYPHLFPELIPSDTGLTDAVRKVLQASDSYMTPVKVRAALQSTGYDIDRYKNILASIHTILKRLTEAKEVIQGADNDVTAYKWRKVVPGNSGDPKPTLEIPHFDFAKALKELNKNQEKKEK